MRSRFPTPLLVPALLVACAPDSWPLAPKPHDTGTSSGTPATPTDTAPGTSTDTATDPDVAPWSGCAAGGPEVVVVSERVPPSPVVAGSTLAGEVVLANCGTGTWRAAAADAATGHKLAPASPPGNADWGVTRLPLPADVPPGHRVRVPITATAPARDGTWTWQWLVLDEWVRWLAPATPAHVLEVTGGLPALEVHPASEWESSAEPVDGPDMELLALRYVTIHYPGVAMDLDGDDDVYEDQDTIDFLRNLQHYSLTLNDRGWTIGYNSIIAPDGDEWEARGHQVRNAASGCLDANRPGYTLMIQTADIDLPPNEAQVEGARRAVARIRAAAAAAGNPHTLVINGHRDVAPLCGLGTACPGEPIYDMLGRGAFEP